MTTSLKYLGISAFELTNEAGTKILVDPFISGNAMCPFSLDDIGEIDMVLVTHGAPDHMGDAVTIAIEEEAFLVCGPEVKVHALKNGVEEAKIRAVLWGDHIELLDIGIQTVECRHISFMRSSDTYLSGIPLSFVITTEIGTRIYNVGDTAIFSDIKLISELYNPNILLVPVGGESKATGGYAHLSPREAALMTQWVAPEFTIPVHYGPNSKEPIEYEDYTRILAPTAKVCLLKPGETVNYNPESHELTVVD
jgi:L-ascorbate metabolism protein UlaG (beta-lactamase superfamily)